MSSSYGENIRLTVFGQSHSPAIGVTVEGLPAGEHIDFEKLYAFLSRRAPGQNNYSTARKEADMPEFVSGIKDGILCGPPLTAIIRNSDTRSKDYSELAVKPRPGHADYVASVKYNGAQDYAGGGHFSGRLTAPLCIAGGICLQLLEKIEIKVFARIYSIGGIRDNGELTASVAEKEFPVNDDLCGESMKARIAEAKADCDSVGGIIECVATGVPVGLGDPMFDGMENRIASIVFGVPAVKGLEFGKGFASADMIGSEHNDPYTVKDGKIVTKTNNNGGILGGITNGMPILFRVAIKPTPSVAKEQDTVDLTSMSDTKLAVKGRHDPCIVPRAVPVIEAAAAVAIYDAYLSYKKHNIQG